MKNFMEQNLETVDKHKMTIDELLFLQNLQEDLQKAEITCNGNDAIATYYVLKEQVRKYIDPFFGNVNYLSHAVQKFLWKWLLTVVTITHL